MPWQTMDGSIVYEYDYYSLNLPVSENSLVRYLYLVETAYLKCVVLCLVSAVLLYLSLSYFETIFWERDVFINKNLELEFSNTKYVHLTFMLSC